MIKKENLKRITNETIKLSSKKKHEKKIIDFFDSLTEEEIKHLLTVMYAGRGTVDGTLESKIITLEEYYEDFKEWKKDDAIRQMLEKMPLADYLKKGMKYFNL